MKFIAYGSLLVAGFVSGSLIVWFSMHSLKPINSKPNFFVNVDSLPNIDPVVLAKIYQDPRKLDKRLSRSYPDSIVVDSSGIWIRFNDLIQIQDYVIEGKEVQYTMGEPVWVHLSVKDSSVVDSIIQ